MNITKKLKDTATGTVENIKTKPFVNNSTFEMSENDKEVEIEKAGPQFDPPVYIQRYTTVRDILFKLPGIEKLVDFGCAEGKFIKYLKKLPFAVEIACVDLSECCIGNAARLSRPIAWDFVFKRHKPMSIKMYRGSVSEKDSRLQGYDAVTCIELIEHLQNEELENLPSNIFGFICPKIAIFTTPNFEFNVLFPQLKGFRHWDHKFEWTREQFKNWCYEILAKYPDYTVEFLGIGDAPEEFSSLGSCTQVAIFKRNLELSASTQNCCDMPYILVDENKYPGRSNENCEFTTDDDDQKTTSCEITVYNN